MTLTGAQLRGLLEHAVGGWPGNGRWLHVSGFSFDFDASKRVVSRMERLEDRAGEPIADDEKLSAVTLGYVYTGGDDYAFPEGSKARDEEKSLRDLVRQALGKQKAPLVSPDEERTARVGDLPPDPCAPAAMSSLRLPRTRRPPGR